MKKRLNFGVSMNELKSKKIGVLMGGRSSEREISLKSGEAILRSLKRMGYNAIGIDVSLTLIEDLKREKVEVAFIALHGRWGEDGTIQGLLEIMGIPYTGTGVGGSAIAIDKALTKLFLKGMDIDTPAYTVLYEKRKDISFPLPLVVKPAREGSTIGTTIVRKKDELEKALEEAFNYGKKVIIEEYIEGREITVGIVKDKILPFVEIKPKKGFYDFFSKYTKGMTEYIVDVDVKEPIREKILEYTKKICEGLEIEGCARIDMILSPEKVHVIDINTSPGMTETSLVPLAWSKLGRTFDELVEEILLAASLKA